MTMLEHMWNQEIKDMLEHIWNQEIKDNCLTTKFSVMLITQEVGEITSSGMTGQEVCGYIDVKVPSKGRKFGQWKAWRKQWCVINHNVKSTIHIQLSNTNGNVTNCLEVPHNAVLCRSESRSKQFAFGIFCSKSVTKCRQAVVFLAGNTETETQEWMHKIRTFVSPHAILENEFYVSLVDTCHSRTAGLAGLYGTLNTSLTGITINDPSSGQIKAHWKWTQIDNISVQPSSNTIDDNKICIIHTSREFSCGEGELRLFCSSASDLQSCLTQIHSKYRCQIRSSPLPAPPSFHYHTLPLTSGRRLSRSEGDLRCWPPESPLSAFHLRSHSTSRASTSSEDETGSPKIASLISASLGLMLSTPGCSEPDNLHDYHTLDAAWQNIFLSDVDYQCLDSETEVLPDLNTDYKKYKYNTIRRESGVSIASGVYEEIQEQPTEYYEELYSLEPGSLMAPPPLPPRRTDCVHNSDGDSSSLHNSEECNVQDGVCDKTKFHETDKTTVEPDYLPMSPGGPYSSSQATYVTMANLVNNTHVSEPVT